MRKIIIPIFIFVLLSSFASASYLFDDTGLEYKFDFILSSGTIPDLTGNGYTGDIVSNCVQNETGVKCTSGYARHTAASGTSFPYTGNFTLLLKANLSAIGSGTYMGWIHGLGGWSRGFRLNYRPSNNQMYFQGGDGSTTIGATTAITLPTDMANIVITNNKTGTTNQITIYVDGDVYRQQNITGNYDSPTYGELIYFYEITAGIGGNLTGNLYDSRAYTRLLSAEEIESYSNAKNFCKMLPTDTDWKANFDCSLDDDFDLQGNDTLVTAEVVNYGNITNSKSLTNRGSFTNHGRYN